MKNSSATELYILNCFKSCWHKIIRKIKFHKSFDAFTTTALSCSYIYHAEELPELPFQISVILSTHLLE